MDVLQTVAREEGLALYEIVDAQASLTRPPFRRFVASTPETRRVTNQPEFSGYAFVAGLRQSLARVLPRLPGEVSLAGVDDRTVAALCFLRGGLNFGLAEVLHRAFAFNRQTTSFITSERYLKHGQWLIRQDQYRKFALAEETNLILGDVIATGTTLDNGLEVVFDRCARDAVRVRSLTLVTIGCDRAEHLLRDFHQRFVEAFPGYRFTALVYLEARFALPPQGTNAALAIPGTDLMRYPALCAPEFERSQYEAIASPVERCVIYDMGSRAFDVRGYAGEVCEYWRALAMTGLSLEAAYRQRWPEHDCLGGRDRLRKERGRIWPDVDPSTVDDLFEAFLRRQEELLRRDASAPGSLEKLAAERLAVLERMGR